MELDEYFNLELNDLPTSIKKIIFDKESKYNNELNCLPKFVEQIQELDTIIIGVNSSKQLKNILDIRKTERIVDFRSLATENLSVIDPRNWLK